MATEEEYQKYLEEVRQAEIERQEWKQAEELAAKGVYVGGQPKTGVAAKVSKIYAGWKVPEDSASHLRAAEAQAQYYKEVKESKAQGLEPVTKPSMITTPPEEIKDVSQPPGTTTYSPYDIDKPVTQYKQSWLTSAGQSVKNVLDFGTIGKQGFETYLSSVFEPFKYSGRTQVGQYSAGQLAALKKYDVATPFVDIDVVRSYEKGIGSAELSRRVIKAKEEKYLGEYEKVFTPLQTQVTAGTLGVEEANKILGEQTVSLGEDYSKDVSRALYPITTTGKQFSLAGPSLVKLGAVAGTSIFGGPVGKTLVYGYFIGLGEKELGKGFLGEDLTAWERGKAFGLGGLYTGGGLVGFSGAIEGVRADILSERIKTITEQRPTFTAVRRDYLNEGIMKDVGVTYKQLGGTRMLEQTEVYSQLVGGKQVISFGGKESWLRAYEYGTGREVLLGTGGKLVGGSYLLPTTEGITPSFTYGKYGTDWNVFIKETGKELTSGQGIIKYSLGEKIDWNIQAFTKPINIQESIVGGITKRIDESTLSSISGNIKEIRFGYGGGAGFRFEPEYFSIIKEVTKPDITRIITTGIKTTSTPSLINIAPSLATTTTATTSSFLGATSVGFQIPTSNVLLGGTGLISVTEQKQVPVLKTRTISLSGIKDMSKLSPIVFPTSVLAPSVRERGFLSPAFATSLIQPQKQRQRQILKTLSVTAPVITTAPRFHIPFGFDIPAIIGFPFFPKLDFSEKMFSRAFKGKRKVKYTPSFEALAFGIRGKQPKGREMGLRIRPIPKGYSFAFKKFKLPKFSLKGFGFGTTTKRKRRKKRR